MKILELHSRHMARLAINKVGEAVAAMDFTSNDADSELMSKLKALVYGQKSGQF